MTAWSVTPIGAFPPAEDDGFPQFIQWQQGGYDLGGPDADTVDFGPGLVATRGTGESANVITVTAGGIFIGVDGVVQSEVSVLNIGSGIAVTIVGDVATLTTAAPHLIWQDVPADYTLKLSDAENGLSTSGTTGSQNIFIPGDVGDPTIDFIDGQSVIVFVEGAAGVEFVPVSGVTLLYPNTRFLPFATGQYAALTLIKRAANTWILCGDMLPL
jgi:hypothetical protein